MFCCVAAPLAASGASTAVHRMKGDRWDGLQQRWVLDNLEKEAKTVPADDEDILKTKEYQEKEEEGLPTEQQSGGSKTVKETKYYDVLGVPTDAGTKKEIHW